MTSNAEFDRYRKGYPEIMEACQRVLESVYDKASPLSFPRMLYWLGKEHGSGKMDLFQNCLIVSLCQRSEFSIASEPPPKIYMYGTRLYDCRTTDALWLRTSYEFRMLAFQERLSPYGENIPNVPQIGAKMPEGDYYSASYYATVGFEPREKLLQLDQWSEFLLESA